MLLHSSILLPVTSHLFPDNFLTCQHLSEFHIKPPPDKSPSYQISQTSSHPSTFGVHTFKLTLESCATCKSRPPVKVTLKTKKGLLLTAANCSCLSKLPLLAVQLGVQTGSSGTWRVLASTPLAKELQTRTGWGELVSMLHTSVYSNLL